MAQVEQFERVGLEQRLPNSMEHSATLTAPQQILHRDLIQEDATRDGEYVANQTIKFNIKSDPDKMANLAGSFLKFKNKVTGTVNHDGSQAVTIDQWSLSLFRRLKFSIDGRLVEDIDGANTVLSALFILYANENSAEHLNSLTGEYKFASTKSYDYGYNTFNIGDATAGGATGAEVDFIRNRVATIERGMRLRDKGVFGILERAGMRVGANTFTNGENPVANNGHNEVFKANEDPDFEGSEFIVPLSLLFGMGRTLKALPVGNYGSWQIEITLDSNENVFWASRSHLYHGADGVAYTPKFTITEPKLYVEYLTVSNHYSAMLDSVMRAKSPEEGIVIHIDSFNLIPRQAKVSSAGTQNTYVYTANKKYVKSITTFSKYDKMIDSLRYAGISGFPSMEWEELQLKIGSTLKPQRPLDSYRLAYAYNALETGSMGSLDWHNLQCNKRLFEECNDLTVWGLNDDGNAKADLRPELNSASFGTHMVHFNLRRSRDDPHDLDGVDLTASASGQFSIIARKEKAGRVYSNAGETAIGNGENEGVTRYALIEYGISVQHYNESVAIEE